MMYSGCHLKWLRSDCRFLGVLLKSTQVGVSGGLRESNTCSAAVEY